MFARMLLFYSLLAADVYETLNGKTKFCFALLLENLWVRCVIFKRRAHHSDSFKIRNNDTILHLDLRPFIRCHYQTGQGLREFLLIEHSSGNCLGFI